MESEESPTDIQQDGMATIELSGVPDEVLEQMEYNQDGICSVSLVSSTPGQEYDGDDRSSVGGARPRRDEQPPGQAQVRERSLLNVDRGVHYALRVDKTRATRPLDDLRGMYNSVASLRRDFARSLQSIEFIAPDVEVDESNFQLGFIRPGHGAKGQKVHVSCDEDLLQMYEVCRSRRNHILLWYALSKEQARGYEACDSLSPVSNGKQRQSGSPSPCNGKRRRVSPKGSVSTSPTATASWQVGEAPPLPAATAASTVAHGDPLRPLSIGSALPATSSSSNSSGTPAGFNSLASPLCPERDQSAAGAPSLSPASQDRATAHAAGGLGSATPSAQQALDGGNADSRSVTSSGGEPHSWAAQLQQKDRIVVRNMVIQQLRTWHDLRQADVITEETFLKHKTRILADLDCL